ncbi:Polyketide cyclase/dehydrase [Gracilaria domingensis]|nr:Polyketide cyclase/dehydrase [Gracilaria domingensis]
MVRVSVPLKIEAPNRYCFELFADLSKMSEWSSTLEAVERDAEDPSFSEWKFAWNGVRLSWRAKDVENVQNQTSDIPAIRWRSVTGLVHTGEVQFEDVQHKATNLVMTVDYDIESLLASIMRSSLVSNFVEGAIENDLTKFRSYALRKYRKARMSGDV